jgi:hypothetical protein
VRQRRSKLRSTETSKVRVRPKAKRQAVFGALVRCCRLERRQYGLLARQDVGKLKKSTAPAQHSEMNSAASSELSIEVVSFLPARCNDYARVLSNSTSLTRPTGSAPLPFCRNGAAAHKSVMAQTGHAGAVRRRLLLRVERTCRSSEPTSDFDPERTRTGGSFAMRRMVCVQSMLYHSPSFPWGKPDEAAEVYCPSR